MKTDIFFCLELKERRKKKNSKKSQIFSFSPFLKNSFYYYNDVTGGGS